jgi:acetyl esterase/lipase
MKMIATLVGTMLLAASSVEPGPPVPPVQPLWPPAGTTEIALWPEGAPIGRPEVTGPEEVRLDGAIAGRSVLGIRNVTRPTMTLYRARGRNTGAALLVFPGGGYQMLAIDLEGSEVCDWAAARGITCAVLKYRVPQTWRPLGCHCQRPPVPQMGLEDAQRAMGLLRQRALSLGVDPHRIGVLGFSAGGHLVAEVSNTPARTYHPVDAADALPSRPDFAVGLYPGHLWAGEGLELYPFDTVRADAPPTFLLQAEDDPVDDVHHSLSYFHALRAVHVPVEMHIYAEGGHAFGLRRTSLPITHWTDLLDQWLRTIRMVRA